MVNIFKIKILSVECINKNIETFKYLVVFYRWKAINSLVYNDMWILLNYRLYIGFFRKNVLLSVSFLLCLLK